MLIDFARIQRVANGVSLPVSIAIHSQNPLERPLQVSALAQERDFQQEGGGYTISSRHLAVWIRDVDAFIRFRRDFGLRNFSIRMIRTIFVEDMTLTFPNLRRVVEELPYLQMIRFTNVRFDMTSWRNIMDQMFLFHSTRQRIVNFENCVFLEDVGIVRIRGTARIMANRIPIYFYRHLAMHGYLMHMDNETGKWNFFSLNWKFILNKF